MKSEDSKLDIGTTVFIMPIRGDREFNTYGNAIDNLINTGKYPIIGVITAAYYSDDRSYHGSPSYELIYIAEDPKGVKYTTDSEPFRHNRAVIDTLENFGLNLKDRYNTNKKKIKQLGSENTILLDKMKQLRLKITKLGILGI